MIRQYAPSGTRFRYEKTPRGTMQVGVVPVGTICRPGGWMPTVIVEAWLPRDYAAWNGDTGKLDVKRIKGGHIALVRSLRDGKRFEISDAWLVDREI